MSEHLLDEYHSLFDLLKTQVIALKKTNFGLLDRINSQLDDSHSKIEKFTRSMKALSPDERQELNRVLKRLAKQVEINQEAWINVLKTAGESKAKLQSARRFYQELGKSAGFRAPRYSQNV